MRIYTYPGNEIFYKQLNWICQKAGLKDPVYFTHLDLHMKLSELTCREISGKRGNFELNAAIAGLHESVVLFSEPDNQIIATFIMALKKNQLWPMLAVITPDSQDMSLSLLLEHLWEDRMLENKRRNIIANKQS